MAALNAKPARQPRVVISPTNLPRLRKRARLSISKLAQLADCSEAALVQYEAGGNLAEDTKDRVREALRTRLFPKSTNRVPTSTVTRLVRLDPEMWQGVPPGPGILVFFDFSDRAIYVGESKNLLKTVRSARRCTWFVHPLVSKIGYAEVADDKIRRDVHALIQQTCKVQLLVGPLAI